jgi:hypothetical protein
MKKLSLEEKIELLKSDIKALKEAQKIIDRRFCLDNPISENQYFIIHLEKELDIYERILDPLKPKRKF